MKKYIAITLISLMLIGCSTSFTSLDIIRAEGFMAYAVASFKNKDDKRQEEDNNKRAEEASKSLQDAKKAIVKSPVPKRYIRMLSAAKGCPPCNTQKKIFADHKWIFKTGVEENNTLPYHGLYEEIKDLADGDNPLIKKYSSTDLPFFQLVVDGKVTKTHAGLLSHEALVEFIGE